jgi:hypothetical protein
MRYDCAKFQIHVLLKIWERSLKCTQPAPKHIFEIRVVTDTQYHVIWKVFSSAKSEPTYKFIVSESTGNISALILHISPNTTQNQLEVYHNRK